MEANQILQSDILDILFEGKNKSYGAYDLRKTYHQRIELALGVVLLLIAAAIVSAWIGSQFLENPIVPVITTTETTVHPAPKVEPKQIPVRKSITRTHVPTVKYTVPVVTKNELVVEPPVDVTQLEKARIDFSTKPGTDDPDVINPPTDDVGTNVVGKPINHKATEDYRFKPVEIEAAFPGGDKSWQKYIQHAVASQLDEFTDNDYGTCVVQFIVDTEGKVSEVQATTMKGSKLAEIAVNAIKKGPRWIPAVQNGRYVTARRIQPVTLLNPNE